jgi:hypothetical protein
VEIRPTVYGDSAVSVIMPAGDGVEEPPEL